VRKNHLRQSTPEAPEIHRLLRMMRDKGCSHAVVEATSHGLSPVNNRLGDVKFDVGVLTNISHEHLDFHKTLDRYIEDKSQLFRALSGDKAGAVLNRDERYYHRFASASNCPILSYSSTGAEADLRAVEVEEGPASQSFTIVHRAINGGAVRAELPQPGRFNIDNCLAALGAVSRLPGEDINRYIPAIAALKPIKGRMVPVEEGQEFQVVVDYAHTPGSFEKLFPPLREQVKGRLIAVFSSAGERDIEKREILGEIASRYCDLIVLADEDPRGERPMDVLEAVAAGCRGMERGRELFLIEDRSEAIHAAFEMARSGDMVLLLGKGHEGSIIYADGPIPWDEEQRAREILREMGYQRRKESVS
ncbi:MAG TPA: UDP-N-acetylmuramyl-tripeptide synthetase, partial [Sediminispirochaeta sp.]|nr:UDP-N-acetylmuramyl-tripeptide synthetase [Sediminispirochaeta sp.]